MASEVTLCPFAILGTHADASMDELRTAFRRAALSTHPDKLGGSHEAFGLVRRAYEMLAGQASSESRCPRPTEAVSSLARPHADTCAGESPPGLAAEDDSWGVAFDPWAAAAPAPAELVEGFDPWSVAAQSAVGVSAKRRRKRERVGSSGPVFKKQRFAADDPCHQMTRNGVYGFRPSSSEYETTESEGERAIPARSASTPATPTADAARVPRRPPESSPRAACGRLQCSIHQRLRLVSDLAKDPDGNVVCRAGRECP